MPASNSRPARSRTTPPNQGIEPANSQNNFLRRPWVTDDGQIALDDEVFGSPSGAAKEALGGTSTNGWEFWVADIADGQYSLAELRNIYAEASGDAS